MLRPLTAVTQHRAWGTVRRLAPSEFGVRTATDHGVVAGCEGPFWLGLYRDEASESVRPDPSSLSLVGLQRPTTVDDLVADIRALESLVFAPS